MRYYLSRWIYERSVESELYYLRNVERKPAEQVRPIQRDRLNKLLSYSAHAVPYYKEAVSGKEVLLGEDPLAALSLFPLLTKKELREESDCLQSQEDRPGQVWNTSGGSTGEPARFLHDGAYLRWNRATKIFFDAWTGYRPGQPKVILWGASQDVSSADSWKRRMKDWLLERRLLSSYQMGEDAMREYIDVLNRIQPDQLLTYAESGAALARFARREGLQVRGVGAVLSSAGTLFPDMREVMEDAFQAPVFNRYGSREVGDMACECEAHDGLHINALTHFIELLKPDGSPAPPGESGEVVVTLLTNYSMPLIRYRIGDVASWAEGTCACGRSWPRLAMVHGRVTDHFLTAEGSMIYGGRFRTMLYGEDEIKKYQWVQESLDRVQLRVVLRSRNDACDAWRNSKRPELVAKVRDILGPQCELDIEVLEEIPVPRSGKHRYTISRVTQEQIS